MTGKNDDSFVGLRIKGNDIHFFYPESYRFDEESESVRSDIIDLLRTISIAKTSSIKSKQHYKGTGWVCIDVLLMGDQRFFD